MKLVYIVGGLIVVIAWLALGLFVAQGPQPEIIVPAEKIFAIGPLTVSNTLLTSWVVMAVLIILSVIATRSMTLMPGGIQNFFEAVIAFLVGQIEEIAGEKNGRRFFVVIATIFIYIIVSNWFGLLPFFNAVGKTEDVNAHVIHQLSSSNPDDLELGPDGKYITGHKFAGWKMDGDSGLIVAKPRSKAIDFKVLVGDTPGQALDRYIVFIAKNYAGFDVPIEVVEGEQPLDAATVAAARDRLDGKDSRPLLMTGEGHGAGHEMVESAALHTPIGGIDMKGAQKFALVVPFFRGTFSDVNNTLAMGIIAFLCIEFWGFQALGVGYLKKFFNLNGIMSFVGILELLSEFIRIISFTFRLFGNIFAGEVLVLMLTFLMPFLFVDVIYGLELFVGFIQASVFALLTLVFAVGAVEHHGDEEHHEGHHGEDAGSDAHHHLGTAQAQ